MRWLLALLLLFTAVFDGPSLMEMAGGGIDCGLKAEHVAVEGAPDPVDGIRHSLIHFHAGQGPCGHVHIADSATPATHVPTPRALVQAMDFPALAQSYVSRDIAPPDRPPAA
ncbi:hypothetical protein [Azospirillum sp. B4]|uniref:hypothetical protein n=1 Tax=Azospirillum sp. B4 TaxID=95605 RepID=UPI00034C5AD8|nr:hypothetical protein [Azospirillum sp. B4]